jgi:hypothetical protein
LRGERLLTASVLLVGAYELSRYAFNSKARYTIRERAIETGGRLQSEISGRIDAPLQAAHINHRRGRHYNDPCNGVLMTVDEHLIDHIVREGENGLSKTGNYYARESLTHQVVSELGKGALERVYLFADRDDAKDIWWNYIERVVGEVDLTNL